MRLIVSKRLQTETGVVGRLFVLLLLGAGLWYLWKVAWPDYNPRRLSATLETAVNQELYAAGVYDHQVLSQVRREQSKWGLTWIQADRRVAVQSPSQREDVLRRLRAIASRRHCRLEKSSKAGSDVAVIRLGFAVFQRVELLPLEAKVKGSGKPSARIFKGAPRIAVVVDDVAYDDATLDRYAALGIPLTFAVLPRDRHSKSIAEKAHRLGYPVILHLPMEPHDVAHNNPGSAGLYLSMSPDQLKSQFEKNVASVPHLVGINNHMGSAFTEDEDKMKLVMGWVKEKGLFFLDSRTSARSAVVRAAKALGVPCRVNETFLDNSDTVEGIEKQLDQALKLALRDHGTIAIGHYRRKFLAEALAAKIPEFREKGVQFVPLTDFYAKGSR